MNVVNPSGVTFVIDGGGAVITTGSKVWAEMPFAACLQTATMVTVEASSIEVGIIKNTFAAWGGAPSALYGSSPLRTSSAKTNQITTLTTWSVSLAQGDWVGTCVIAASGDTLAYIALRFNRT